MSDALTTSTLNTVSGPYVTALNSVRHKTLLATAELTVPIWAISEVLSVAVALVWAAALLLIDVARDDVTAAIDADNCEVTVVTALDSWVLDVTTAPDNCVDEATIAADICDSDPAIDVEIKEDEETIAVES